ncbi:MAG: hypothetical protein P8L39_15005 [Halioglobus sp.]|nr:hypothetical protein [Halioglobus sp.]
MRGFKAPMLPYGMPAVIEILSVSKSISTVILSILLVIAGVLHFTHDSDLAGITPLPYAYEIVWLTGFMEFLFAGVLLVPKYRRICGMLLALFLLSVLPANINMAMNDLPMFGAHLEPWEAWLRVGLQFPLIIWVLWATGFWAPKASIN